MWGWQERVRNLQFKVSQLPRQGTVFESLSIVKITLWFIYLFVCFLPAKRVSWRTISSWRLILAKVNLRLAFWRNLCRQRNLLLCKSKWWIMAGRRQSGEWRGAFLCVERQPKSIADVIRPRKIPSNLLVNASFGSLKNVVLVAQIFHIN